MSIFKSAKRQVAVQEQQSIVWDKAATAKDIEILAERRTEDLANAEQYVRLDGLKVMQMLDKYIKITDMTSISVRMKLQEFRDAWKKWDEGSLGLAQQSAIYQLYAKRVPSIVKEYFSSHDQWQATEKLDTALLDLAGLMASQVESLEPMPLPITAAVDGSTVFPQFAIITPGISKQMAELERLWEQAQAQATTVEDRFFLDQLTLTYLPDMWRMYQPFAGADEKTWKQAAKLVSDQVTLLTQGVQRILENTRETSLKDLKAHKSFLEKRLGSDKELTI